MLCVRGLAYRSLMTFAMPTISFPSLLFSVAPWAALLHLNERGIQMSSSSSCESLATDQLPDASNVYAILDGSSLKAGQVWKAHGNPLWQPQVDAVRFVNSFDRTFDMFLTGAEIFEAD
jgi:hypothetical protein